MDGGDPSVHRILYALKPKPPFSYPVWFPSFFLFAMVTDGQGICSFEVEMRLVRLDEELGEFETSVGRSKSGQADLGNEPLRVQFISFMMPPILLPEAGVYRLYLRCDGRDIGIEVLHAR